MGGGVCGEGGGGVVSWGSVLGYCRSVSLLACLSQQSGSIMVKYGEESRHEWERGGGGIRGQTGL